MAPTLARTGGMLGRISLRLRLTLWMVGVFAALQVILALVFLLYQQAAINRFFDERLTLRSRQVSDQLEIELPNVSPERLMELRDDAQRFVMAENVILTVYDARGIPLVTTAPSLPDPRPELVARIAAGEPVIERQAPPPRQGEILPPGEVSRIATNPLIDRGGASYALITQATDTYARNMLGLVRTVLLWSVPLGVTAAAGAGWLLAGLAVAPFRAIGRLVGGLAPESINAPVAVIEGSREVKELTEQLERARKRLESGFATQERFMANVSHELRTPIATLLTESQTLTLDGTPEPIRSFVRSTQEEMRRLGRLVNGFMALTRVRAGKPAARLHSCGVNDLVMESVARSRGYAAERHIRIEAVLAEEGDLRIDGEPELLQTMLDNLLRNAIRYSPENERVVISAARTDGQVDLRVVDLGPGIPPEMVGVFDRVGRPTEQIGRGRGLGLEIAQGVAELHGGHMTAVNLPAQGCEFRIELPISTPLPSGIIQAPSTAV